MLIVNIEIWQVRMVQKGSVKLFVLHELPFQSRKPFAGEASNWWQSIKPFG
jgi:hypothetical protein